MKIHSIYMQNYYNSSYKNFNNTNQKEFNKKQSLNFGNKWWVTNTEKRQVLKLILSFLISISTLGNLIDNITQRPFAEKIKTEMIKKGYPSVYRTQKELDSLAQNFKAKEFINKAYANICQIVKRKEYSYVITENKENAIYLINNKTKNITKAHISAINKNGMTIKTQNGHIIQQDREDLEALEKYVSFTITDSDFHNIFSKTVRAEMKINPKYKIEL